MSKIDSLKFLFFLGLEVGALSLFTLWLYFVSKYILFPNYF